MEDALVLIKQTFNDYAGQVLILVLMEDALVRTKSGLLNRLQPVLILVLMEDALVLLRFQTKYIV